MDLEPLNPEPFDPTRAPSAGTPDAATPDAATSESPRRRRRGYAVAGTVAGLALVGVGFLLGRTSSGGHNVSLADASAIQDAAGGTGASGGSLGGPATRRNIAAGNVANVASDGTSFTLTTPRQGSLKVTTSKSTTFLEQTTGKVSDATPGMRIRVQGTRAADGTVAASHLAIAPASSTATPMAAGPMMAGPMGRGTGGTGGIVKSNDNGTLTVTEPNGTDVKVTTTSATVVVKTVTASMSDVKPGLLVLAQGTPASDGSLTATHVDIIASGVKGGFGIFGGSPGGFFRPGPRGFRGGGGGGSAGVSTAPSGPTA